MTPLNPQQSTRDRIKAKFPGSFDPTHHDVEIRAALDELYAELCPPLDADAAVEIEALKATIGSRGSIKFVMSLIDRAFALGQRHHVAALAREEAGHGETIDERDKRVEQIGQIYRALGGEHHWSNLHDLGNEALELATDLVDIQRQSAQPGYAQELERLILQYVDPFDMNEIDMAIATNIAERANAREDGTGQPGSVERVEVLPCWCERDPNIYDAPHHDECPAFYRPAVATASVALKNAAHKDGWDAAIKAVFSRAENGAVPVQSISLLRRPGSPEPHHNSTVERVEDNRHLVIEAWATLLAGGVDNIDRSNRDSARMYLHAIENLPSNARATLARLLNPATSDKEARVKECERIVAILRSRGFHFIAAELEADAQAALPTAPTEGE